MGIKDLIITPVFLMILLTIAVFVKNYFSNTATRKYFIAALLVRFLGAIFLGFIYQFYYESGDTFIYWRHGSQWIWKSFMDNPSVGLKLLFTTEFQFESDMYFYSKHIWYYRDSASYFIVRLATIADLITLGTYSSSALLFACFSFSGAWAMFSVLQRKYPANTKWLAFAILFVPSVIFWGSGILKDTVTLASLGWIVWALVRWFDFRIRSWKEIIAIIIGVWIILIVKIYILLCFIPVILIWLMFKLISKVQNQVARILVLPFIIIVVFTSGFLIVNQLGKVDERYNLSKLPKRIQITAYDIRYGWGARTSGDGGYDIGLPDGTVLGTLILSPKAVNVTLFRPYLWEVRNPLMLLSSIEALLIMIFTIKFVFSGKLFALKNDYFLFACLMFSLLFAFAVGVSTFNFGTLMRYKIPIMPFYITALGVISARKQHINQ
ncbi:hypothetical protein [Ekhidna sp.]|uniref:hypothetical protein n=1 Tax=Ekhidna sp. TaxID=2608089 RepID=UPI003B5078D0